MRLLLDSHVLLWWLGNPRILKAAARNAISNPGNQVYVSAAVAWEIAIKKALGKLNAPDNLEEVVEDSRFIQLQATIAHAMGVMVLPNHHRDPFDRLLIVQAMQEGLTLVTRDAMFGAYGVSVLGA